MTTKIIFFLAAIAYSMIVSQSFMYTLALKDVQLRLDANSYTEFRKLIDISMRESFKYVIYAALLTSLTLMISTIKNPGSLIFITSTIAFIALVVDTLLTVKGSLPINDVINTWSANNYPYNWSDYRAKWLTIFQYRQFINITGFVSLLIGGVFGTR